MASGPGDAGAKRKGNEYFGPYAHTYAIRKTLDQLLRTFPVRTCTDSLFGRQRAQGRPCLLYHIEKCSGPCIDAVAPEDYQQMVDGLRRVPPGGHRAGVDRSPGPDVGGVGASGIRARRPASGSDR